MYKAPAEAEAVLTDQAAIGAEMRWNLTIAFAVTFRCSFVEQTFRFSLNFRSNTSSGPRRFIRDSNS